MHRSKAGSARVIALLSVAVLAFAAYGATAAFAKSKAKPTTVKVATVPGVGAIVVDSTGRTLYTLTDANGAAVACTGACLQAWPAMTVTTKKVTAPKSVKSIAATADTHQVTSKGLPLYYFVKDTAPGMANGEGINSFGGTWHVVKAAGGTSTTPTTGKSDSGGSSYGY
jgi:predicted lipoprotein with Yx(FWY)xxD motif